MSCIFSKKSQNKEGGHCDVVRVLLENNHDTETKDLLGFTPLMISVRRMDIAIVKLLIAAKANISAINPRGETPSTLAHQTDNKELKRLFPTKTSQKTENDGENQLPNLDGSLNTNTNKISP